MKKKAYLHVFMLNADLRDLTKGEECEIIATSDPFGMGHLVRMVAGWQPEPNLRKVQEICDKWNCDESLDYYFFPGVVIEKQQIAP